MIGTRLLFPLIIIRTSQTRCTRLVICLVSYAAYFYAAQAADESILGLCSDDENQLLAAADTQGVVSIWDISNLGIELNDKSKEVRQRFIHNLILELDDVIEQCFWQPSIEVLLPNANFIGPLF